jgi:hypothetical protein
MGVLESAIFAALAAIDTRLFRLDPSLVDLARDQVISQHGETSGAFR